MAIAELFTKAAINAHNTNTNYSTMPPSGNPVQNYSKFIAEKQPQLEKIMNQMMDPNISDEIKSDNTIYAVDAALQSFKHQTDSAKYMHDRLKTRSTLESALNTVAGTAAGVGAATLVAKLVDKIWEAGSDMIAKKKLKKEDEHKIKAASLFVEKLYQSYADEIMRNYCSEWENKCINL